MRHGDPDGPTDGTAPGLEIAGVVKSFGSTRVLRGVDLTVTHGDLLAVLGPSGCGKTTLLRAIAGFVSIDRGAIRVDGRTVTDQHTWVPPERRRIGIVPQEGAVFPHLRVRQNVAFGIRNRADREAQVRRWLDLVGLSELADARPHELSGGQQQRVALARALAAEPAVVLLDEPFAALDAGLRVAVRAEIAAVLRETMSTAVLVTHDQQEALSTADRVAVMLDGQVAHLGTPAEVYATPATLDVARFVGETNVLDGHVLDGVATSSLGRHSLANRAPAGAAHLVARPEQVALDESGTTAVVTSVTFTGPDTVVDVRTLDGIALTARVPGATALRPGDPVSAVVQGPVLAYPRARTERSNPGDATAPANAPRT